MIIITGSATIHPEHFAEALALGVEHSVRSRAEPGCVAHDCHVDAENPQRIVFVEEWADMAAVKTHFAVPESENFFQTLRRWALLAPVMQLYQGENFRGRLPKG